MSQELTNPKFIRLSQLHSKIVKLTQISLFSKFIPILPYRSLTRTSMAQAIFTRGTYPRGTYPRIFLYITRGTSPRAVNPPTAPTKPSSSAQAKHQAGRISQTRLPRGAPHHTGAHRCTHGAPDQRSIMNRIVATCGSLWHEQVELYLYIWTNVGDAELIRST